MYVAVSIVSTFKLWMICAAQVVAAVVEESVRGTVVSLVSSVSCHGAIAKTSTTDAPFDPPASYVPKQSLLGLGRQRLSL